MDYDMYPHSDKIIDRYIFDFIDNSTFLITSVARNSKNDTKGKLDK